MPAVSTRQQRAAAIAYKCRMGEISVSRLSKAALNFYKSPMSTRKLKQYASTKESVISKKHSKKIRKKKY